MEALLHVIHESDIAVCVGAVDVWEFDGGTGMAAIEDDEEGAAGGEFGDEMPMEGVAVYLAVLEVVDGDDGVVEAAVSIAVWVFDLAAVARVVQEALGVGFGD